MQNMNLQFIRYPYVLLHRLLSQFSTHQIRPYVGTLQTLHINKKYTISTVKHLALEIIMHSAVILNKS